MLFNSLPFAVFLPVVFLIYWLVPSRHFRLQNMLLLAASYVFYGWWDWRYLLLIAFNSLATWGLGLAAEHWKSRGRWWVWLSCLINFGLLGFFKYFNFFTLELADLLRRVGFVVHLDVLQVILPVGISFYTFQAVSYTIDVYRGSIKPCRDLVAFMAYVSYFPQLVAGPIERAAHLLPQFLGARRFDYGLAVDGCRQMLWGFFKKMVVADNCALVANQLLNSDGDVSGFARWVGMVCFAMQIYGDFSGYSDIAIGCSKLFGIRLMQNFNFPYFSRDIAEFWRRWHISLSTWFRDYVYIPLGGSRGSVWISTRNVFAIFLISGFWHGANWTFLAWGGLHAAYFLPLMLRQKNRQYQGTVAAGRWLPSPGDAARIIMTFTLVTLAWVFFRAPDLSSAMSWIRDMLTMQGGLEGMRGAGAGAVLRYAHWIALLIVVEWINRGSPHGLHRMPRWKWVRWGIYLALWFVIVAVSPPDPADFIYFQF